MISNDLRAFLLFIEPTQAPSSAPLIDPLTRKMAAAFRAARPSRQYCGFHDCTCGALSDTKDFMLPDGRLTNSLCVHYLAYHRAEVPTTQLEEVLQLNSGELEPTKLELSGGRMVKLSPEELDAALERVLARNKKAQPEG